MSLRFQILSLVTAVAIVSCGVHDGAEQETADPLPQLKKPMPKKSGAIDATLQSLVDAATADLIKRLESQGVSNRDVTVLQAERVTWRSGALGCPMPDRGYTMVLTPGMLIRLRAAGAVYEYHSSLRGPVFLCEPPGRIETPAPGRHSQDPT